MSEQKSALDRISDLEKRCQSAEANVAAAYNLAETGLQKLIALEQSYAALAKTMHALISSLKESGHVSDEKVMEKIRKLDDDQDRERIEEARKDGILKGSDAITETSIIVVKNIVISKENPTPITLSNHRTIEIASDATSPKLRQELIGKKIGDTARMSTDKIDALYVILQIYELAEVSRVGEDGGNSQENANEEKPQEQPNPQA